MLVHAKVVVKAKVEVELVEVEVGVISHDCLISLVGRGGGGVLIRFYYSSNVWIQEKKYEIPA